MLDNYIQLLASLKRHGGVQDFPEGSRYIVIPLKDRAEMSLAAENAQKHLGFFEKPNKKGLPLSRFLEIIKPTKSSTGGLKISDTMAKHLTTELDTAKYLLDEKDKEVARSKKPKKKAAK